jgi:uncharacterized RDD family membrane protein YckC
MKCPKCSYLGFETGDRCKNCGYDFSLLAAAPAASPDPDLNMRVPEDLPAGTDRLWMDRLHMDRLHVDRLQSGADLVDEAHEMPDVAVAAPEPPITLAPSIVDPPAPVASAETAFPLFAPREDEDDQPLIKFPAPPRPPLSVRRTPEQPRLRPSVRPGRTEDPPLSLDFPDDRLASAPLESAPLERHDLAPVVASPVPRARVNVDGEASSLARRVAAGLTDHAILVGVDAVVLYSTLRMAGLTMGDWQLLPPVPMLAFLVLLKLSYFGAFTAACGQTIGKMAAHIRVVADDAALDPARAIRRTLMAAVSLITFGAGFIPAFLDPDHRALHDRVARTRVVELPSA